MAKIDRKALLADSEAKLKFDSLHEKAKGMSERLDCSVKAVAILCGVDYEVAHAALEKAGRRFGHGAYTHQIKTAINDLGYRLINIKLADVIANYPGAHKNLQSITNHHPHRFNKVWRDGNNYCFFNATHVAAVINGELIDWSIGRPMRVTSLYKVVKV